MTRYKLPVGSAEVGPYKSMFNAYDIFTKKDTNAPSCNI